MSYILDALRKSEQQRQSIQPESVTDRILINPPQPNQRPTKWIIALVMGNLLVIAYLSWLFIQKTGSEPQQKITAGANKQIAATAPAKPALPQIVSAQNKVAEQPSQPLNKQEAPTSPAPSIAELIAARKVVETEKPAKPIADKKPQTLKKEAPARKASLPTSTLEPYEETAEQPISPPTRKNAPDLNDLPYEVRNTLPNLTINVFSYAQQPEDRFVIIDMVKYKTGQLVKGAVKLKEIRPDSIILQQGNETFRVERP
jgi:general secretion pathway protein B